MILSIDDERELLEDEILILFDKAGTQILKDEMGVLYDPKQYIEVSLIVTNKEEMQNMNREYRSVDKVTDVLSFPQYEFVEEIAKDDYCLLGDIVICYEKALEQAEEFGNSRERELVYLFVHSMLHLLGYDHMEEEDKKKMRTKEEAVMASLNLSR